MTGPKRVGFETPSRFARAGVASVEFVLVLPLLAVMTLATVDIGRLLFDYHLVSKSLRDATRYLTRVEGGPAGLGIDCAGGTVNPTSTAALNAMRLAMTGSIDPPSKPTDYLLAYWRDSGSLAAAGIEILAECTLNDGINNDNRGLFGDANMVSSLVMSATVSFPLLNGWLLGGGSTLSVTLRHKMAHLGP